MAANKVSFNMDSGIEAPKGEGFPPPPPAGYPTNAPQTQYAEVPVKTQKRGEKGFIEGCLAGLCCCWLCEECC